MRVAVVGSRNIAFDYEHFGTLLTSMLPDETTAIVSGGARGVDRLAARYAREHNLPVTEYLPDYGLFGKTAPLIRNRTIIDNADFVIAVWDGTSRGTLNSIDYTLECNKPLAIYYIQHDEIRFFKPHRKEE